MRPSGDDLKGKEKWEEQKEAEKEIVEVREVKREFGAMVSRSGSASFLVVGGGVADVLEWEPEDLLGRRVPALMMNVAGEGLEVLYALHAGEVKCRMTTKRGGVTDVIVISYPNAESRRDQEMSSCRPRLPVRPDP